MIAIASLTGCCRQDNWNNGSMMLSWLRRRRARAERRRVPLEAPVASLRSKTSPSGRLGDRAPFMINSQANRAASQNLGLRATASDLAPPFRMSRRMTSLSKSRPELGEPSWP